MQNYGVTGLPPRCHARALARLAPHRRIKFFSDGSMGSSTAAFFEPYSDDPATRGLLHTLPRARASHSSTRTRSGFQPVVHAIGDRANALVLDIFERLQRGRGRGTRRPRIEHAQVVRRGRPCARFAGRSASSSLSNRVTASTTCAGRRRRSAAHGAQRPTTSARLLIPGPTIAFGTDWFVAPLNPMLGLYAAVTRQFADGTPKAAGFPKSASRSSRRSSAIRGLGVRGVHRRSKGQADRGKLADLVVLSRDIFTVPPRDILDTRPVLTIVGGRIVYSNN